jgi:S1-C subfamily serine protease
MNQDYASQLARAERALQQHSVETILERIRAIIGPANMPANEPGRLAREALDAMGAMSRPKPQQLAALEYVIRLMRPAPLSRAGKLDNLEQELSGTFPDWKAFQESVQPYLYSVGRIESSFTRTSIGTGFLVEENLLATNKHVLDQLSFGTDVLEKGQAVVRFGQEFGTPDSKGLVNILSVVAIHDSLDIALLEIEKAGATARQPVTIESIAPSEGDVVVAIGYPIDDRARNPLFIQAIFGGKFGVKRAAPGEIVKVSSPNVFHDCSTLGGNSGSPIFSIKTARVIGLHSNGFFMYRNEAIDGKSLNKFVSRHV